MQIFKVNTVTGDSASSYNERPTVTQESSAIVLSLVKGYQ